MACLLLLVVALVQSDVDQGNVYYGDLDGAKKPAEVSALKVFNKIPVYQEIKKRELDKDDPAYHVLLAKANKKFYAAVRKVAEKYKYDAVVEKGSADLENAPEITKGVIRALPK